MRRWLLAACGVLGLSGLVLASTVVGLDTFTTGVSTDLTAHTPDTGTGWTAAHNPGSASANANSGGYAVIATTATSNHIIYTISGATPSSADYDVKITLVQLTSGQADNDPFLLVGRYVDGSNYYAFGIDGATSKTYALFKKVAGTVTVLSTASITASVNDVLTLSMRGDTLKVYQNAGQLACVVDASLSATGVAGMAWGNAGGAAWGGTTADTNVGWRLDTFTVTDFTGEGGDDNCGAGGGTSSGARLLLMGVGGRR